MTGAWRQGRRVPRNVYRGDEPIAMVATEEIAAEIVAAGNAREAVLALCDVMERGMQGTAMPAVLTRELREAVGSRLARRGDEGRL